MYWFLYSLMILDLIGLLFFSFFLSLFSGMVNFDVEGRTLMMSTGAVLTPPTACYDYKHRGNRKINQGRTIFFFHCALHPQKPRGLVGTGEGGGREK